MDLTRTSTPFRARKALAALAVSGAALLTLTGCGDAQKACDALTVPEADVAAADAATRAGFEVEKEVEMKEGGTAECVWDTTQQRLVGSTDSE